MADAEIKVVGVVLKGGVGGLEVEERFVGLGRPVMLDALLCHEAKQFVRLR